MQPHINYLSTVYDDLVKRDELVYAEKCSFMEALLILRSVIIFIVTMHACVLMNDDRISVWKHTT